jgi:hypothetical protein
VTFAMFWIFFKLLNDKLIFNKKFEIVSLGFIFLDSFAGQGVLYKDSTDWLDGVRSVNSCTLPSFPGMHLHNCM